MNSKIQRNATYAKGNTNQIIPKYVIMICNWTIQGICTQRLQLETKTFKKNIDQLYFIIYGTMTHYLFQKIGKFKNLKINVIPANTEKY